ncbi:MAG: hypothetical protein LV480_11480 [Methylacidiphilales bacterium]|nr:hypothetical protein [Candidatus Methylacidiphilales bacterium]
MKATRTPKGWLVKPQNTKDEIALMHFLQAHKRISFPTSSEGNWGAWIEFCLRGAKEQAQEAVRVCEALKNLRDEMHTKESCGSGRLHAIIDELFGNPYVTISNLARHKKVSYPTAKADVDFLVKNGILMQLEGIPVKTYVAKKIFEIAYGDV